MKKDTLIEIILGTIGGLLFSFGMCMCLLPEWNLFVFGIIVATIGFITLLCIIPVYRKTHPKKKLNINFKKLVPYIVGVFFTLLLGVGMSIIMVNNPTKTKMIVGIIIGIVGLSGCILNYPIYSYMTANKNREN